MSKNGVVENGPERHEMMEGWRNLHDGELQDLFSVTKNN
jgi:hypothetical protein